MTGHGGWPLNVFCTPDQVPFFAGTYFPPTPRQGMPAWPQVLEAIAEAWHTRRDEIRQQGDAITERLGGTALLEPSGEPIPAAVLDEAVDTLRGQYDSIQGGFGGAPKFPPSSVLRFLLAHGEREMSLQTLRSMAGGGINDQIGGGFARYAVDSTWTVPHFEKMLYDNALLARAYLHGWLVSDDPVLRRTCEETLEFVLRELRGPEGGSVLRPRRRLRGRGGQVLRLVVRRHRRRARARRRGGGARLVRRHRTGQLRGHERPRVPRPGAPARAARADPGATDGGARAAHAAGARRQASPGVERARARHPGRGRRAAGARGPARRRARERRVPPRHDARRHRPAAAHVGRDDGEAQRLPRGPRVPARGPARPLRGHVRAALVRRRP